MEKTLIGKEEFLFLINDSCKELETHCNNLNLVNETLLSRYLFDKFLLFVYPNKTLFYKQYLPDNYNIKYRPGIEIYKNKLKKKLIDMYNYLNKNDDLFYKTDTHINFKGNYEVYKIFLDKIKKKFNFNITPKKLEIKSTKCELSTLPYALGDLTWPSNLCNQILNNKMDTYYYNEDLYYFYNVYKIKNDQPIRFLNNITLYDETYDLEKNNEVAHWNIISKYIIYIKNESLEPKKRIVIFYDSFLLHSLQLYFDLFYEVYFIKNIYDNEIINNIKPDYVFEFRCERFLF
jgi:hypothetical protein